MPRCRKILANGKRCRANAISGSKFCLFHTPGQKMKRRKKSTPAAPAKKSMMQRSAENQLAVRGSKKIANATAAYGAYLQTRPESRSISKKHSARYHRDGTRYVGATTSRFTEHYTSDRGRNYRATDGSQKARLAMGRRLVFGGRLIPVLGYGFVIHNTLSGPAEPGMSRQEDMMSRTYQGGTLMAIGGVASHYQSGGSTVGLLTSGKMTPSSILKVF